MFIFATNNSKIKKILTYFQTMLMKRRIYHAPVTEISFVNPEGGMCQVIEYDSEPGGFDTNRRDSGYSEEGDEKWGDLWAEEEE